MAPQNHQDVEGGTINPSLDGQADLYRDDSDEDATIAGTASETQPLRGSGASSVEFGGLRLGDSSATSFKSEITNRLPESVRRAGAVIAKWVRGPDPPRIFSITPFYPKIQHAPLNLLDRYAPRKIHRFWLLILVYASWLFCFSIILRASSFSASIPGYGDPIRLGCAARYWQEGNDCGLNGDQCRPFANASLPFRCPADCHKTLVLTPHAVGDQEVVYKPLVVGGPSQQQTGHEGQVVNDAIYRGDSFICASAVHAGFIENSQGGCGVLTLTGEQSSFSASKRNGYESIGFDSYFPHTFGFLPGTTASCKDLRWPALAISVFFTALLSVFTASPSVFFWSIFVALFFHVALASDPPNLTTYYGLISVAFGRFLPACFCAWVTYKYTVKRSLTNLTAQFEKTVLWLGPAWVGALNNYTFDRIPIQRLTPHDIKAQPGAIPALITIVLSIFFIALGQAWSFRVEGRMPRYLVIYSLMVVSLLIMLIPPGLSLRIHHYILALLLLPGTSFQNRPSLIYQGLLTGLFINGIARWGFDSILQTPSELLEGFQQGSLVPAVTVLAVGARNITFNLGHLPAYDSKLKLAYDGISVLVNDVERFRGFADDRSHWDHSNESGNFTWTWNRHHLQRQDIGVGMGSENTPVAPPPRSEAEKLYDREEHDSITDTEIFPEYFRFAYLAGKSSADFGKAGVWDIDGTWRQMEDEPSLS